MRDFSIFKNNLNLTQTGFRLDLNLLKFGQKVGFKLKFGPK